MKQSELKLLKNYIQALIKVEMVGVKRENEDAHTNHNPHQKAREAGIKAENALKEQERIKERFKIQTSIERYVKSIAFDESKDIYLNHDLIDIVYVCFCGILGSLDDYFGLPTEKTFGPFFVEDRQIDIKISKGNK